MDAALPKYRLVPVVALAPSLEVASLPIFEIDPTSKHYVVSVDCGDLPPVEAQAHLQTVRKILTDLFGQEPSFLLIATRHGTPALQFFQLEPA